MNKLGELFISLSINYAIKNGYDKIYLTNLETIANDEFRIRYGWSLLYVAQKPGGNGTAQLPLNTTLHG